MPGNEPFILFQIENTTYAVRSFMVQQMEMVEQITRVPNAPAYVDGVVFLRGQVAPVINLRERFGFTRVPYTMQSRLIVANVKGRVVALAVDSAREFTAFDPGQISVPPDTLSGTSRAFIEGVVMLKERLVLVLDLAALLAPESGSPAGLPIQSRPAPAAPAASST